MRPEPEEVAGRTGQGDLADANRMLQLVLDTIPVRVFWKDLEGIYLGCNALFEKDGGAEDPEELDE